MPQGERDEILRNSDFPLSCGDTETGKRGIRHLVRLCDLVLASQGRRLETEGTLPSF